MPDADDRTMPDVSAPRRAGRLFERIVVPLDGSEAAESVVERVAPLREPGSPLHLIRVVPGTDEARPSSRVGLDLLEAESYLAYVAARAGHGSGFEVRRGGAVEAILDFAAPLKPDLIALAPRARPRDGHGAIGSTAGPLILKAGCPVFVLGTNPASPAPPANVLVPLDGSEASEASLEPALRIAGAAGATLLLLHVIESLWAAGDSSVVGWQEKEVRATRDRFAALTDELRGNGIEARSLILAGDPAGTIRAQVMRRAIDYVCLATASRGALGRMAFGSVAQKLIGTLPVPAIAVRRSG